MLGYLKKKIKIKKLNIFFKKKFNFYKENKYKKNLLFVDRERVDNMFMYSILSLALSNKYKLNTLILSDQNNNSLIKKIYQKLGYKRFVKGFSLVEFIRRPIFFLFTLLQTIRVVINIYLNGFKWLINNFNIKQIFIGDLIYDSYVRYNFRFIKKRVDFYFLKLLFSSIFRFYIIRSYFVNFKIKRLLVGTETKSRNNGLALRIATSLNIKNSTFYRFNKHSISLISYKKNYYQDGLDRITKKDILRIAKKIPLKTINRFYNRRKNLKTQNHYTANDFFIANKGNNKDKKFLNSILRKQSKKILFASHAFADAPHALGNFIFNDYYEQFEETLKFVYHNDNKNIWIFKKHPNSRLYNEEKIFKNLMKKYKKNNIVLCPNNISVKKLYSVCDTVVTGRGTIGMEFAGEGKRVIIAGSAPYSDSGIATQAKSIKEYFFLLSNLDKTKIDTGKIKKIARQVIYIYENSLNVKTIKTNELSKETNYLIWLKNIYTKNFSYNHMFDTFGQMFEKNICNTVLYKKLIKMI
tara:strand:+ start:2612 stop:4183 length:1572 start_codon:yes stop_codon:yes gene_type:complete